jgi:predicted nucleic acid-binding protein
VILYLDSSAIVKQYVVELGSLETQAMTEESEVNGTSVMSRAEVTAALGKAVRMRVLREKDAKLALRNFNRSWPDLVRTRVTERLTKHAASLAWNHNLRGYDAVHLASAAAWQQALGCAVTMATFDRAMWTAAAKIGLSVFPPDLSSLLASRF